MKFTLTYDGPLGSAGNSSKKSKEKWAIRRQIHAQLADLWTTHPALKQVSSMPEFPEGGGMLVQRHHDVDDAPQVPAFWSGKAIPLLDPIPKGDRFFQPLVRNSLALGCGLKILFMRKEAKGRVYQGGDLDNRIKTLLDALAVPVDAAHVLAEAEDPQHICCLLEDDALVTGLDVQTERLLARPGDDETEVRLIVEVDVRVLQPRLYNQAFLGG
jgi:hypothetical protein